LMLSILFMRFRGRRHIRGTEEANLSILFMRFWPEDASITDAVKSFNSLYEIHYDGDGEGDIRWWNFQFSLWDSKVLRSLKGSCILAFNSLYEIPIINIYIAIALL